MNLINRIFINGIFPAISIHKECQSHQRLQPSNMSQWALRKLRAEKNICYLAAIRLQPLPAVSPEETQMWKYRILAPNGWGAYQRNYFSEPRLLHLPIHRKALNSLTWDVWFSLINNNLFFFNVFWSIIALQWCVSFCFITKWISYTYTICSHISSLLHLNNLLMFPTTRPLSQNPCISWLAPTSPPQSSFSELSETLSPRLQSSFSPNKT